MKNIIQNVIKDAELLKDKYTDLKNIPVNYVCIFCQSEKEEIDFLAEACKIGEIIKETSTGPIFKISIDTVAGKLQLLKIRKPDIERPERGDADFTVSDYKPFKEKYLEKPGFSLIKRENFEMIELYEKGNNVRVYFSFPPLDKQLNLIFPAKWNK
ncbi:MAG: hypothetical protein PHZ07_05035 [Patescibacteria group bacterium]|nr:hypothetical protein [Patescibacteria group bacterium]MDD4304755.1 hypothetical protein [Patescibacteria group bacterium]MDD4695766.1 hypothetical protein [Patescibacteria group bacterium]